MRAVAALILASALFIGGVTPASASSPKQDIREILNDPRFKDSDPPIESGPGGTQQQTGTDSVEPPPPPPERNDWLEKLLSEVPLWVWITLGVIVLLVALRLLVRRTEVDPEEEDEDAATAPSEKKPTTASALERAADQAESEGRFSDAVRLRFEAGVLRLVEADAVTSRPGLTSGQISISLGSSKFVEIAKAFDEIVYGERNATPADAKQAKDGWSLVLAETIKR